MPKYDVANYVASFFGESVVSITHVSHPGPADTFMILVEKS